MFENKDSDYVKDFIKINTISVLYAFVLFISIELLINVYRISRLIGWNLDVIIFVIPLIIFIGIIVTTVLIIFMMKKWMINRKISYWSIFMWFPYFILFYGIFTYLFPLKNGETWFPIFNLLIYVVVITYPIYIIIVNAYATSSNKVEIV